MSNEGYPNLKLIKDSIRLIYFALKPDRVKSFSSHTLPEDVNSISWVEPLIATQHIARLIALHYQLPVTTVIVYFCSGLPVPGRVELSNSSDYYVEIHSDYRKRQDLVAAILAHEIAHIFLHQHGITLEPVLRNEVLTDTTATYLGCGALILNGATEVTTRIDEYSARTERRHFGYLTLEEFGYVLAKRDLLYDHDSWRQLKSEPSRDGYSAGSNLLRNEHRERPFVPRWLPERIYSAISRKLHHSTSTQPPILVNCPCCAQILRIPSKSNKVRVRCAICGSSFDCYP